MYSKYLALLTILSYITYEVLEAALNSMLIAVLSTVMSKKDSIEVTNKEICIRIWRTLTMVYNIHDHWVTLSIVKNCK